MTEKVISSYDNTSEKPRQFGFMDMFFRVEPEHRIGRMDYFLRLIAWKILTIVIIGIGAYALEEMYDSTGTREFYKAIIGLPLAIPTFFVYRALIMKRVIDYCGKVSILVKAFLVFYLLIVIVLLFFNIYAFFMPFQALALMAEYGQYMEVITKIDNGMGILIFGLLLLPSQKNTDI